MVLQLFSLAGLVPAVVLHRPGTVARLASEEVTEASLSAGGNGWSIVSAWQSKAASKYEDVKNAMPDVADIKSAASTAAKKWAK